MQMLRQMVIFFELFKSDRDPRPFVTILNLMLLKVHCRNVWPIRKFSSALARQTDVCIVGAGPVGMVLSLMLSKFGVSNIVIERSKQL
jgi:hypothetical protein